MSGSSSPVEPDARVGSHACPIPMIGERVPARAWGITEGAAGMVSQVRGLAQALGADYEIRSVTLRMPWKKCWPGIIPLRTSVFRNPEQLTDARMPQVVITCGRQAVPASLYLKRRLGDDVFTVHLQDPKINTQAFDLVLAPEHDQLRGKNVYSTRGAIHHIHSRLLSDAAHSSAAAPLKELNGPFVTVLLGGPNNCYRFTAGDLAPLVAQLRMLVRQSGCRLAILPSRRTPDDVVAQFERWFGEGHLVWNRVGENPYLSALALCSHLIITGDSVSMISEAAATEKPVFVFPLPQRRRSRRFQRFHDSFLSAGITRIFAGHLEQWTYQSPNDTDHLAEMIRLKLGERHDVSERLAA